MLAGLLCALVLLGTLFILRVGSGGTPCESPPRERVRPRDVWLGVAGVLVAELPLLGLAPWLRGIPFVFWGDTQSHARVAAELASTGLPHGWIQAYVGGFPFGHHYPPLGWLLLAGEMRAGLDPAAAVYLLGFAATLALPLTLYFGLVRCGASPAFACLGAVFVCSVAPYNPFVGGYETFFGAGLVSQVTALPIVTWLVVAVLADDRRWEAPVAAWLAMASHPQVTVAALVVLGLGACASARRDVLISSLWTSASAVLAGASLYGQGITSLDVPFGWPPNMGWRQIGFHPSRLRWWLVDGDLLDKDRAAVLTALLAAAVSILLLDLRRPASRALVVALVSTLALSVSGHWLRGLGGVGTMLLSFLQPLRVVSLLPLLAGVSVAVAAERAARRLASTLIMTGRPRLGRRIPLLLALLVAAILSAALPARFRYTEQVQSALVDSAGCGGNGRSAPLGYDASELRAAVATLTGARLWYDAHGDSDLGRCINRDGIELASSVPIGTAAAVGAHVGILAHAAQQLAPERPGAAARAEALGVAYLLLERPREAALPGWTVRAQLGATQLASRAVQLVGVGCIKRRWRGDPEEIRARLTRELGQPPEADLLLDPHAFTAIEDGAGPVVESPEPDTGCSDAGAIVEGVVMQSGSLSATVEAPSAIDVAFRVAAFPTWNVRVDGAAAGPWTPIAPGFFSIRLPPGRHRLDATVDLLPHYATWILLALLATAALTRVRGGGMSLSHFSPWLRRR
jgi:hypothetical protein